LGLAGIGFEKFIPAKSQQGWFKMPEIRQIHQLRSLLLMQAGVQHD
jgi:hypothetical protein